MKRIFDSERGMAFLAVMAILVVLCVTLVVVSITMSTHSNVNALTKNTPIALMKAEDGITIAKTLFQSNKPFSGTVNLKDNGWNIRVTYTPVSSENGRLVSVASLGRYNRTVAMNVTKISGFNDNALNKAIFTNSTIKLSGGTYNINKKEFYANSNIFIGSGVGLDQTVMKASGEIINQSGFNDANKIVTDDTVEKIKFPEPNWNEFINNANLTINVTSNSATADISSKVLQLNETGGILYVKVNGPEVIIKGDLNFKKEVTVVLLKDPNYGGDYIVKLEPGSNFNGGIDNRFNILSDKGAIMCNFQNNFNNPYGLIYTGCEGINIPGTNPTVNAAFYSQSSTNFQLAGIMTKGDVYLTSGNFDHNNVDPNWSSISGLENIWKKEPTVYQFNHWEEIAS